MAAQSGIASGGSTTVGLPIFVKNDAQTKNRIDFTKLRL
jgi:hypothetical protein